MNDYAGNRKKVNMGSWSGEEIVEGLERWLKSRRDEHEGEHATASPHGPGIQWLTIDQLLDEVREAAVEGWLPWQPESPGERSRG